MQKNNTNTHGEKNSKNNDNNKQLFSNYSGHHMEEPYRKTTKHIIQKKHTNNIYKNNLIILATACRDHIKKQNTWEQQATTKNNKGFQTSLPMASPQPD